MYSSPFFYPLAVVRSRINHSFFLSQTIVQIFSHTFSSSMRLPPGPTEAGKHFFGSVISRQEKNDCHQAWNVRDADALKTVHNHAIRHFQCSSTLSWCGIWNGIVSKQQLFLKALRTKYLCLNWWNIVGSSTSGPVCSPFPHNFPKYERGAFRKIEIMITLHSGVDVYDCSRYSSNRLHSPSDQSTQEETRRSRSSLCLVLIFPILFGTTHLDWNWMLAAQKKMRMIRVQRAIPKSSSSSIRNSSSTGNGRRQKSYSFNFASMFGKILGPMEICHSIGLLHPEFPPHGSQQSEQAVATSTRQTPKWMSFSVTNREYRTVPRAWNIRKKKKKE